MGWLLAAVALVLLLWPQPRVVVELKIPAEQECEFIIYRTSKTSIVKEASCRPTSE